MDTFADDAGNAFSDFLLDFSESLVSAVFALAALFLYAEDDAPILIARGFVGEVPFWMTRAIDHVAVAVPCADNKVADTFRDFGSFADAGGGSDVYPDEVVGVAFVLFFFEAALEVRAADLDLDAYEAWAVPEPFAFTLGA